MRDEYDFSGGRKNPYAKRIKDEGYSITVHYSPEDVSNDSFDDTKDILCAILEKMSVADAKRLLLYIKDNFSLPYSDDFWETVLANPAMPGQTSSSMPRDEHAQPVESYVAERGAGYKR